MLTPTDHTDVGVLVGFGLQPRLRPGGNLEYRRVLARYRTEPDFKTATDAILVGLNASVLADGDFGLVLGIEPESPFVFRYSDVPYMSSRERRLIAGLIIVGVAAYAYPAPEELEAERIRHVVDVEFEGWLRGMCERLRVQDAAGEIIPEEGLDQAWRVYVNMPVRMVADRERSRSRLSPKCTLYWVRAMMGWLTEQGLARPGQTAGDNRWTLTDRFRIHVKDMAAERAYSHLAEVGRDRQGDGTAEQ